MQIPHEPKMATVLPHTLGPSRLALARPRTTTLSRLREREQSAAARERPRCCSGPPRCLRIASGITREMHRRRRQRLGCAKFTFFFAQFTFTSSRSKRGNSREKSRHETAALRRKTAQNRLQDGHIRGNRHNFASSSQLGPNRCIVWRILTNFELVDAFFVRFGLLPSQKIAHDVLVFTKASEFTRESRRPKRIAIHDMCHP